MLTGSAGYRVLDQLVKAVMYSSICLCTHESTQSLTWSLTRLHGAGESGVDQLVEIIKVLGTPTREEIYSMNPNYTEFKFPKITAHPWSKVFSKRMPADAVDLVCSLCLLYTASLLYRRAAAFCSHALLAFACFVEHVMTQ